MISKIVALIRKTSESQDSSRLRQVQT